MKLGNFVHFAVYLLVGGGSIVLAFFVATQVLSPAHSQTSVQNSATEIPSGLVPPSGATSPHTQAPAAVQVPAAVPTQHSAPPASSNLNVIEELPTGMNPSLQGVKIDAPLEEYDDSNLELGTLRREGYVYEGKGRREPFVPYQAAGADKVVDDLQRYDLNQLRLVGIIWDIKKPKAMVVDPKGKINLVQRGTKMGLHNGYVAVIREGEVVVVEPFTEGTTETYTTRVMNLAE